MAGAAMAMGCGSVRGGPGAHVRSYPFPGAERDDASAGWYQKRKARRRKGDKSRNAHFASNEPTPQKSTYVSPAVEAEEALSRSTSRCRPGGGALGASPPPISRGVSKGGSGEGLSRRERRVSILTELAHEAVGGADWERQASLLDEDEDPLMQVAVLHVANVRRVEKAMDELRLKSPLISRIVQNLHATNVVLFSQRKEIHHMHEKGELAEADAAILTAEVNRKLKQLYERPMADWGVSEEQLARRRNRAQAERARGHVKSLRAAVMLAKAAGRVRLAGKTTTRRTTTRPQWRPWRRRRRLAGSDLPAPLGCEGSTQPLRRRTCTRR